MWGTKMGGSLLCDSSMSLLLLASATKRLVSNEGIQSVCSRARTSKLAVKFFDNAVYWY